MTDAQLNSSTLTGAPQTLNSNEPSANVGGTPDPLHQKSKHFLNPDEAADVLRMDSRTLVRWARLGQVPAHLMGEGKRRLWRFIETELIHWLAERVPIGSEPSEQSLAIRIFVMQRKQRMRFVTQSTPSLRCPRPFLNS
jgi:hypothetical protein